MLAWIQSLWQDPVRIPNQPSRFLQLPAEVRLQIYCYALGQGTAHFDELREHLYCRWCRTTHLHPPACDPLRRVKQVLFPLGLAGPVREVDSCHPCIIWDHGATGHVALLCVCRQVYSEALPVFYAGVQFEVFGLQTWVRFCEGLRNEQLALVRSLTLMVYRIPSLSAVSDGQQNRLAVEADELFWWIVTMKMTGLIEFALEIWHSDESVSRALDAEWHLPLRAMRGLRAFRLQIHDLPGLKHRGEHPETDAPVTHLRGIMCRT
ncbi:hypothetical protein BDW62DRAFT_236 [Aspergillus aurantiobrunneus]